MKGWGVNFAILHFVDSLSIPAVDIFILIAGFFSCNSYRRVLGKPLNLLFQVAFWHVGVYLISCLQGFIDLTPFQLLFCIISPDYFVTLYVVVYLFSPYLNKIANSISLQEFRFFIFLGIVVFSFYAFPIDVLNRDFHINLLNGSPISIAGGAGGCSFVNFALIYLIGAYIRKADVSISCEKAFLCIFACTIVLCIWRAIEIYYSIESFRLTARSYHNPFVIAQATFAFLLFKNYHFKSRIVNVFAPAAFTCYMIHGYFLREIGIEWAVMQSPFILIFHILFCAMCIFLVSFVLYYCYKNTINKLFIRFNHITIPYFNET